MEFKMRFIADKFQNDPLRGVGRIVVTDQDFQQMLGIIQLIEGLQAAQNSFFFVAGRQQNAYLFLGPGGTFHAISSKGG